MSTVVNDNSKIYYTGNYWNDYPKVQEYINFNFTGNKNKTWQQDFKERYANKPFQHGLFLNCGNGWVEREFIDMQIVKQATAFDYSLELLSEAKKLQKGRKINYFQADVNKVKFKKKQFDLIVNVAALHHVQYLNRLCFLLTKTLTENGIFVNFDFIGPHRNQYSLIQWLLINKVNRSLPKFIKKEPLDYPHLPTMIYTDPTEAIHSELIFKIILRYFDLLERHDTGGGIAYTLLTHNKKISKLSSNLLNPIIQQIITEDIKYTKLKMVPSLFSYFICKKRGKDFNQLKEPKYYQQIENQREKEADNFGHVYYFWEYIRLLKSSQLSLKLLYLKKLPYFLFSYFHQKMIFH